MHGKDFNWKRERTIEQWNLVVFPLWNILNCNILTKKMLWIFEKKIGCFTERTISLSKRIDGKLWIILRTNEINFFERLKKTSKTWVAKIQSYKYNKIWGKKKKKVAILFQFSTYYWVKLERERQYRIVINGTDRQCKVVELSMQCCGKLLSYSFETY